MSVAMIIRRCVPITVVLTACDPWERQDAHREAAAGEAAAREQADAAFAALTPAEHLENARAIVRATADDPLSTLESRRAQLDRAERHLHAIPSGAPESSRAAELEIAIADERARLPAER